MDKIYSKQDVVDVIKKVEELSIIDTKIEELLYRGSNDEKLVDRKRELEKSIGKIKNITSEDKTVVYVFQDPESDAELISLRQDFDSLVSRYKKRKIELQMAIRKYTDGNSD